MVKDKNLSACGLEMASFLNQLKEIAGNATINSNSDIAPLIRVKLKQINKIRDLAALMPLLPKIAAGYPASASFWRFLGFKSETYLSHLNLLVKKHALHLAIMKGNLSSEEDKAMSSILHTKDGAATNSEARLWEKYIQLQWRGVIHVSNPRKLV